MCGWRQYVNQNSLSLESWSEKYQTAPLEAPLFITSTNEDAGWTFTAKILWEQSKEHLKAHKYQISVDGSTDMSSTDFVLLSVNLCAFRYQEKKKEREKRKSAPSDSTGN